MTDELVLEMRGIRKEFPGIVANDDVDLDIRRGRGARAPRRERRRQVDADEHPLRALPARRGRDPAARQARPVHARRATRSSAGIGMVHQHFMLIPVMTVAENIVLGVEPREGPAPRRGAAPSSGFASSSRAVRARRRPGGARRRHHRRPAAAGRDPEGALPRGRRPDPRRADGGAHAAGGAASCSRSSAA